MGATAPAVALRVIAGSGADWAWVMEAAPAFVMEGRTLRQLLDWVQRETGWRVRLEGTLAREADSIVLHGSVGALPADRAVFAVLPGAGLEGELRDGTLWVRAPR